MLRRFGAHVTIPTLLALEAKRINCGNRQRTASHSCNSKYNNTFTTVTLQKRFSQTKASLDLHNGEQVEGGQDDNLSTESSLLNLLKTKIHTQVTSASEGIDLIRENSTAAVAGEQKEGGLTNGEQLLLLDHLYHKFCNPSKAKQNHGERVAALTYAEMKRIWSSGEQIIHYRFKDSLYYPRSLFYYYAYNNLVQARQSHENCEKKSYIDEAVTCLVIDAYKFRDLLLFENTEDSYDYNYVNYNYKYDPEKPFFALLTLYAFYEYIHVLHKDNTSSNSNKNEGGRDVDAVLYLATSYLLQLLSKNSSQDPTTRSLQQEGLAIYLSILMIFSNTKATGKGEMTLLQFVSPLARKISGVATNGQTTQEIRDIDEILNTIRKVEPTTCGKEPFSPQAALSFLSVVTNVDVVDASTPWAALSKAPEIKENILELLVEPFTATYMTSEAVHLPNISGLDPEDNEHASSNELGTVSTPYTMNTSLLTVLINVMCNHLHSVKRGSNGNGGNGMPSWPIESEKTLTILREIFVRPRQTRQTESNQRRKHNRGSSSKYKNVIRRTDSSTVQQQEWKLLLCAFLDNAFYTETSKSTHHSKPQWLTEFIFPFYGTFQRQMVSQDGTPSGGRISLLKRKTVNTYITLLQQWRCCEELVSVFRTINGRESRAISEFIEASSTLFDSLNTQEALDGTTFEDEMGHQQELDTEEDFVRLTDHHQDSLSAIKQGDASKLFNNEESVRGIANLFRPILTLDACLIIMEGAIALGKKTAETTARLPANRKREIEAKQEELLADVLRYMLTCIRKAEILNMLLEANSESVEDSPLNYAQGEEENSSYDEERLQSRNERNYSGFSTELNFILGNRRKDEWNAIILKVKGPLSALTPEDY